MFRKRFIQNYSTFFGFLVIVIGTFVLYRDLLNTFFTQDEWWELGRAIEARSQGLKYYFTPWGGHVVPLMLFFLNLQFKLFGTNAVAYAWISLIGHVVIATLWMVFITRLTKNKLLGFLSGLIFVINTAPFHSITYIAGGATHVLGSTLFFLLSIFSWAKYLQSNYKKIFLFLSLLNIFLAVFFMEYVAYYFFLIPVLYFLFSSEKRRRQLGFWIDQILVLTLGIGFFLYRFFSQKIHIYGSQFIGARTFENSSLQVNSPVFDYFSALIKNTAKLLPRILYQVWMNEDWIFKWAKSSTSLESFSYKMSALVLFFGFLTIFIFWKQQQKFLAKLTISALLLIIFGGFPAYVFTTFPNVIYSRYLYSPALGFALFLGLFLIAISKTISRIAGFYKQRILVYFLLILGILTPLAWENYRHITGRLWSTVVASKMRQKILSQTLNYYPQIKPKTVFFGATNLQTPGIPWPVHLGYSLLVMYAYQGSYQGSEKFFRSNKLWPVSEGYEDFGDIGFGYFHTFNSMLKTLKKYKLTEDNVYGLYWQATLESKRNLEVTHRSPPIYDGELLNITDDVRRAVKKLLQSDEYSQLEEKINRYVFAEIEPIFDRSSKATFINQKGLIETVEYGVPRLTNGSQGKNLGILIEGYSANLLKFSEDFDNPCWKKSERVKVRINSGVAPDGQKKADELSFEEKEDYLFQRIEYPSRDKEETDYTFSIYLRSSPPRRASLFIEEDNGRGKEGEILIGPSWQRFQITEKLRSGGPIKVGIKKTSGELEAWGGQLEEYPYATSYIRTEDKIEFRSGDILRAYPKKSIPLSQGTVGFWVKAEWSKESTLSHMLFYNGDDPNRNSIGIDASPRMLRLVVVDEGGKEKRVDYHLDYETFQHRGWNYIAASWGKGVLSLYLNGQSVGKTVGEGSGLFDEKLIFAWPYRIGVHHGWYSLYADAVISNIQLYPRVLSQEEILGLYLAQKNNYN